MSGLTHIKENALLGAEGDPWFSAVTGFWTYSAGLAVVASLVAALAFSLWAPIG